MKPYMRVTVPVAALFAIAGQPALAQEVDVGALISPNEKSIEFGAVGAFGENPTTGMYTGLADYDALPIASGRMIQRDEKTGTWLRIEGLNLGREDRSLHLGYERQGQWKLFMDLEQIHKSDPKGYVTNLSGVDDTKQDVGGADLRGIELETDRYNGTIGLSRSFAENSDFNISYRAEQKEGGRQFGTNMVFLVDQIDQLTHEVDAKLNYAGKRLQLTGGFLGSFFMNDNEKLVTNISSYGTVALPPDNQAYNIYLGGGYNFTPKTRGAFKLSYTLQTQTEDFFSENIRSSVGRTDLGGKVENYFAMGSVNSRVSDNLTLLGKVRYTERKDKTPVVQYVDSGSTRSGFNDHLNRDTTTVEGEANYRLPADYRLTGGLKYEHWERGYPPLRQASFREETDEYSSRAQVSKRLTETLGGTAALIYSERDGSAWLDSQTTSNAISGGLIDPPHMSDRRRRQWLMNIDWAPTEKLSVQGRMDGSADTYRTPERLFGPDKGQTHNASIDAAYQLNRDWSLTSFVSRNEITRTQRTYDSGSGLWTADLRNIGYAGGIGVRGTPRDRLKVGADIQLSRDTNEYSLSATDVTAASLPDATYNRFDLKLFADYALSGNSSVKFGYNFTYLTDSDFGYDENVFNEVSLGDQTSISLPGSEYSHQVGVSYTFDW